jgi:cytochrome c oxidase accessory protein FixG
MEENFRDRSALIAIDGSRVWMYPKSVKGFYHRYRVIFGLGLLAVFFILPFIKVHGEPFFLFNVVERKFILFSVIFWPQDSYLFFLVMISLIIFIILFTVTYGRLWCGWACPQTVLMEIVFRKIEYFIEGSAAKQRELNGAPMSLKKIRIKTTKHAAFLLVSFAIAFTFISYILGMERMLELISNPLTAKNNTLFMVSLVLTGVLYFIYSQVRELVCTIICPYGRLQGALVDANTMVVAYDYVRGEPRNPRTAIGNGDCIDCKQCVAVCPTGIDIRNGTQMECVSCTACIDACDTVMAKVNKPPRLIKYASLEQIRKGKKFALTTRGYAYSAVLLLLVSFFVFLMATRAPIDATVLRTPGLIYQEQPGNQISNLYNIKVVNKSRDNYQLSLKLISHEGKIVFVGNDFIVKPSSSSEGVFFVYLPKKIYQGQKLKLKVGIYQNDKLLQVKSISFLGPE